MRALLCLLLTLFIACPAGAQPAGRRLVSIAFHDVVDRREEMSTDAVTNSSVSSTG
jgi:hypothetical protein